jgi:endoglucanase
MGFSWAYWEFCAGFGVYDLVKKEWRPELLGALQGKKTGS